MEVTKTDISFLTIGYSFEDIYWHNSPFFVLKVFDIEDVFFFFLGINVNIFCKEV